MSKKTNKSPDILHWTFMVVIFVLLNPGCISRDEGCLDANAKDFDLEADRPCLSCCTYPTLSLVLSQKWDDNNFAVEDTLYDIHFQPYKIIDLKYLLTSWSWIGADGAAFSVDSVFVMCEGSMFGFTPDIVMIDTRQFTYPLGTVRLARQITSSRMTVGAEIDYSCLLANEVTTPVSFTPLSPLYDSLTSTLHSIRLVVQRDLDSPALDTIFISETLAVDIPADLDMIKGLDAQLELTVNYADWFQAVDRSDPGSFQLSVLTHIMGSFSQTP